MSIKRDRQSREIARLKAEYPRGTRVLLIHMGEDPRPIKPFTRGTVDHVDDIGTVHCHFDNGRFMGLIIGVDDFRKLTEQEIRDEIY